MFYRFNTLLILRLLLISLTTVLLRKFHEILIMQNTYNYTIAESLSLSTLEWKSIDIEKPPRVNDSVIERQRLHELLAVPQYKCVQSVCFGDSPEAFTICKESGAVDRVLIVTGNSLSSGKFERDLPASKWTVFLPERSDLIEQLKGDVEVHYLTELNEWNRWMTWDIEYAIHNRTYDIAKLDLYATQFKSFDQPRVVRQLNMTARHLALTINVESTGGDDATRVIGEWYQLLYWLFYSEGYALIGATSSGICGRKNQNCRYYVSLMRLESMELRTRVMAPVFGLGSPKEEQKRLINFLHASACRTVSKTNFPTYCQKDFYRNNTVILVSYRHLEQSDIPPSLSGLPNFHVITPIKSTKSLNATVHRIGIGPEYMKQTIDGEWKLDTLKNLLNKIAHGTIIDLIIIDLDGGEIDSYDEILQLARSSRFLQLSVRGRIWPEENENYRQTYWNLRQMQNYGYSMQFANVNLSFYDVVFVKE